MPLFITTRGDRTIVVCKPKPPRIGAAYTRPNPFHAPYKNTHNPDQDWVQDALLYGGITRNGKSTNGRG